MLSRARKLAAVTAAAGSLWAVSSCTVHQHQHPPPGSPPPGAPPPGAQPGPPPGAPPGAQPAPPPGQAQPLPRQPAAVEPPASQSPPAKLPPGVADGRPAGMHPGAPVAYWIWRGPRGGWHLRTTTAGLLHEFRGRVAGVSAPIVAVHPSRVEFKDRVVMTPTAVWFRFATKGHVDGFDFAVGGNSCVRFDLQLDRGAHAERIFVGAQGASPPSNHFILCP